ncbi:hypothetical protein PPL_00837 [Heterostelium album PN500]|uniref:Uncharacterized protein n=1 Tax=Heterostelium pallidum (strain ATCC 26659 / Pp 5 / PN500) TaxID=670386 RepID=D3AXK6_HETP5|nr:hypothetical protein PPL_00837 [Heterostelium album PN500]EFA86275.1 hypothetical protein PPL_00837 [Heterostelium album PN500]|eukprot:XP_020438380.1 hypothetical protein PPL_00837 [Heterostelium album PN500]
MSSSSLSTIVKLKVNVHPNAKQSSVVSVNELADSVDIRISQPPTEGRANEEVIEYLSEQQTNVYALDPVYQEKTYSSRARTQK